MSSDHTVRVLLPAGRIPLDSTVTKRTGTKEYILKNKLRVFPMPESKKTRLAREERGEERERGQEITALDGTLLLVCDGDANAITNSTELVWVTTRSGIRYWLDSGYGEWMSEEDDDQ